MGERRDGQVSQKAKRKLYSLTTVKLKFTSNALVLREEVSQI